MKTKEKIYEEIDQVNIEKRNLILMYLQVQNSSPEINSFETKIENTKKIYFELRKLNDKITELECELVSVLAYEI